MDKNGGPAFPIFSAEGFPTHDSNVDENVLSGMTLRDYFAAKALSGMCAGAPGSHLVPPNAAKLAYEYADSMLAEREK